MTDESHFIAAMAADPDDDTPRLVFAPEHGLDAVAQGDAVRMQARAEEVFGRAKKGTDAHPRPASIPPRDPDDDPGQR